MKHFLLILSAIILFNYAHAQQDTIPNEFDSKFTENGHEQDSKGAVGSFGKKLSQLSSFVSLNGYATNEFLYYETGENTFNQHYFNLLASAEISERIFAEIQMEYEYGGSSLTARYAQIDYKLHDLLIIRTGKFLVPAGEYNEYLYPEFISKTVSRAFVNKEIVPVSWGEVGAQVRGQLKLKGDSGIFKPFYSLYIVNGLKSTTSNNIRSMRGNALDTLKGSLAFGGNIGAEIGKTFNIAFNYYTGDYNPTGESNLTIFGTSFAYDDNKLSLYGAAHAAVQEYSSDNMYYEWFKFGFYGQVAYKYKNFEPVLRYDQIRLDGLPTDDRDRITFGLNYHFYENCVFKINYELINNQGIDIEDNLFSMQIAVGF